MNKISEDNCVLNEFELDVIEEGLEQLREQWSKGTHETLDALYKKIMKLNDLAKNNKIQGKINDDNHVCTGEPPF